MEHCNTSTPCSAQAVRSQVNGTMFGFRTVCPMSVSFALKT